MNEPVQFYSPPDIARRCHITTRHARRVICSVIGHRTRYRLTAAEVERVVKWHAENRLGRKKAEKDIFFQGC